MSRLPDKREGVMPGDSGISARMLNAIRDMVPRQVVGGSGIDVSQYGDRLHLKNVAENNTLPDITNYLAWAVVLKEYDDCLLCCKYDRPTYGDYWLAYQYDPSLGQQADNTFFVAKPVELQKIAWDGRTVVLNGTTYQYAYGGTPGERNVEDDAGSLIRVESVSRPYVAGDIILAVRGVTGLYNPVTQADVFWLDVNNAARRWEGELDTSDVGDPTAACKLVALQQSDCLAVRGTSIVLAYSSGKWTSADLFYYPGGSGVLAFWRDGPTLRLTLTVTTGSGTAALDLIFCAATGCWIGGPLTGHIAQAVVSGDSPPACSGTTFSVCLSCVGCGVSITCCPGILLARTIYAKITGTGTSADGTIVPMTYGYGPSDAYPYNWSMSNPFFVAGPVWWSTQLPAALTSYYGGQLWLYFSPTCTGGLARSGAGFSTSNSLIGCSPFDYRISNSFGSPAFTIDIGTAPPAANCFAGPCGVGVPATLTATRGASTGDYTLYPSTVTLSCVNDGAGGHYWQSSTFTVGGTTRGLQVYSSGAGGPPMLDDTAVNNSPALPGYVCNSGFAATFSMNNGAGATTTWTVTG